MIRLFSGLMWCCASFFVSSAEITLYAYHSSPPFVINSETNTGLNQDFIRALQLSLGTAHTLRYQQIARQDLNARLDAGLPTIVLWSNSVWFHSASTPYLWSDTVLTDRDVFVSLSENQTNIQQLSALTGSTLGTIKGYSYPGVNELIQQGQVIRRDAGSDKENLNKLLERTVDYIIITRSSFLYYARQQQFLGKVRIVGQPYPAYQRQLLLTHHYLELLPMINTAIQQLSQQTPWLTRLELYGLKAP